MRVYEAGTNPAGGLRGALACGSNSGAGDECPCKRRRGALGFIALDQGGSDPAYESRSLAYGTDQAPAAGIDWHWLAIAALALLATYALWPKPDRERRNVERRDARAAYLRKLDEIDGGAGKRRKKGKQ